MTVFFLKTALDEIFNHAQSAKKTVHKCAGVIQWYFYYCYLGGR